MSDVAAAVLRQFLLFVALLTPLELLWPARREQTPLRRGLATDLLHFALDPFLVGALAAALLGASSAAVGALVPAAARARLQAQPWAAQLAEIVLLSEVATYWVHRWSHEVRWLWRFHAVHHSAERLDWLVAHRQHPLEAAWLLGVANLPVALLGFSTEPLYGFILAQKLYTAFLHGNLRLGYGPCGAWLASPRFHHWHHDGASARGRNFASLFPWLDRLWGTYDLPAGFPSRYGCDEPVPRGWLGQLAHPLATAIAPAPAEKTRSLDGAVLDPRPRRARGSSSSA
jgi:sterol desaturase/sphingolipid hydroxylase (fatty acid hydroxylase superfamily)